jgi:hypothetical protein
MTIKITVKGTPIEIPDSGSSPNWAPGIIDAITELADAIDGLSGSYDVSPQAHSISLYPENSNIEAPNLVFPSEDVRAVTIFYSVFRKTNDIMTGLVVTESGQELTESGSLQLIYNQSNSVGSKWLIQREYMGDANITFSVTDSGQILFSTLTMTGENHQGFLSYRAITILNNV